MSFGPASRSNRDLPRHPFVARRTITCTRTLTRARARTSRRREEELCRAIYIAKTYLTVTQYHELLSTQTTGGFFKGPLTTFYGSTLLNFIASFGLKRALKQIVEPELNDPAPGGSRLTEYWHACNATGFLPLHCAVANGRIDMYNLLTGGITSDGARLPRELICKVTQRGAAASSRWARLSPLQLASKLGDKAMCKHILRDRLAIDWSWGPLSSYRLVLDEIDSAGREGNDVMEIISDFTASLQTQELLLDEFMQVRIRRTAALQVLQALQALQGADRPADASPSPWPICPIWAAPCFTVCPRAGIHLQAHRAKVGPLRAVHPLREYDHLVDLLRLLDTDRLCAQSRSAAALDGDRWHAARLVDHALRVGRGHDGEPPPPTPAVCHESLHQPASDSVSMPTSPRYASHHTRRYKSSSR